MKPASVKSSRQTTYESLLAVVKLLLTTDPKEFAKAYSEATHDDNSGMGCWYYMTRSQAI